LKPETKNVAQNKKDETKKDETKSNPFAKKPVLLAAAVVATATMAACVPDVKVNNIFYEPDAATEVDTDCTTITECTETTVDLRVPGNSAGPSSKKVGDATISLLAVVDQGSTKAAEIEMDGCEQVASATLVAGQTSTLGLGNDSFEVTNSEVSYDASGVLVKLTVKPVCPPVADASVDTDTDTGTETDTGTAGSDSGS